MGGEIYAEVTGQPVPSFHPWPEPNEEGGGVVLPCKYILTNVDIIGYNIQMYVCVLSVSVYLCKT